MTEQKSSDNRLALIGLVLTGLSVLIGLVQIWDTTRLAIKAVVDLPAPVGWILVGVLFVVGAALVVKAVTKKSILLRPEALRLDPKNPDHMIGREDDIQSLIKSCRDSPLVFLVGESGAGKSTLVNVGLRPALVNSGPLLPIYVDVWGQDWEDGPRRALTDAMWEALDDDGRHTLGSDEFQNADDLKIHFSRFKAKLGRSPLVIFDQFDDYQSRHRRHFFPGNRRTWLPAKQLIERNTFWRDVVDLLEQGHISCLFVTRNDTANGLESVRFIEPGSYPLDRVQSNLVVSLLDKITSANGDIRPAILNPERGWDRLKNRLATDLSEQGAVLPQQMKTVLAGLATLPRRHLTIANYERVRGVTGLEARHIESRVQGAARQTDAFSLGNLALALRTLAAKLTAEQAFSQVAWWFAVSRGAYVVDLLRTSIERIDQETSNKYIVELIKHPTSGHRETQQLLTILGELNGAGAFENDVWRAVDWAKRKGLDVTSQAKRPRPEGITTAAPRTISKNAR